MFFSRGLAPREMATSFSRRTALHRSDGGIMKMRKIVRAIGEYHKIVEAENMLIVSLRSCAISNLQEKLSVTNDL